MSRIRKASRKSIKLKIGLGGPSGFGKTFTGLLLACGLAHKNWDKVLLIDTEGSGDLYADHPGLRESAPGEFSVLELEPPYNPEAYISAIQEGVNEGFEAIVIDSITHEWKGKGGCLEIAEDLGGSFGAWAEVTPRHEAFIAAILQSPVHVITTVREKTGYEMVSVGGKSKVVKHGMKQETRDGFEYELSLSLKMINQNNYCETSKDRTSLFHGRPAWVPSIEDGVTLRKWAEEGLRSSGRG